MDDNNKPIDAVTSVKILQDKATQEALAKSGITVANIVVPEPPRQAAQSNSKCKQLQMISSGRICFCHFHSTTINFVFSLMQ